MQEGKTPLQSIHPYGRKNALERKAGARGLQPSCCRRANAHKHTCKQKGLEPGALHTCRARACKRCCTPIECVHAITLHARRARTCDRARAERRNCEHPKRRRSKECARVGRCFVQRMCQEMEYCQDDVMCKTPGGAPASPAPRKVPAKNLKKGVDAGAGGG